MIDLTKISHTHYAQSYYAHSMSASLIRERRDLYLEIANREEMRGDYKTADQFRRLALKPPRLI